ncbi:hypothetical protein NMY22_g2452 [Coprinellus aureogranulatus]|nr:hypothetical protein NMY22_g2452 [Coprinellus aureogranulatus]
MPDQLYTATLERPAQNRAVEVYNRRFSGTAANNKVDNGGCIDNGQTAFDRSEQARFARMVHPKLKFSELWTAIHKHLEAHPQDGNSIVNYLLEMVDAYGADD